MLTGKQRRSQGTARQSRYCRMSPTDGTQSHRLPGGFGFANAQARACQVAQLKKTDGFLFRVCVLYLLHLSRLPVCVDHDETIFGEAPLFPFGFCHHGPFWDSEDAGVEGGGGQVSCPTVKSSPRSLCYKSGTANPNGAYRARRECPHGAQVSEATLLV